jgi:uncharacterized protein YjiS (DUF1127 family)
VTYPIENFYPAIEPRRASNRLGNGRAFEVASRKAAAAVERTRLTADFLAESYAYWRCVRETSRQLSVLDDVTLRDIGLHRSQIPHVARRLALAKQQAAMPRTRRDA